MLFACVPFSFWVNQLIFTKFDMNILPVQASYILISYSKQ
jgi:hypothetical protein